MNNFNYGMRIQNNNPFNSSATLNNTLGELKHNRYYLTGRFKGIYLTKREAECIICLARGRTLKQTAKILHLSDRTIECFVNKLKQKLFCSDRAELIEAV